MRRGKFEYLRMIQDVIIKHDTWTITTPWLLKSGVCEMFSLEDELHFESTSHYTGDLSAPSASNVIGEDEK
jgi:hypothetical protein